MKTENLTYCKMPGNLIWIGKAFYGKDAEQMRRTAPLCMNAKSKGNICFIFFKGQVVSNLT
ncbi:MAG TPA: hypothetical protein DE060_00125 [Lentisphaeria bacterium]|nr:hypothetical protein [Lentisphaeria bacterium]HCG47593.1 hypothetical protein [Lentisphaeria bacterium]